MNLFARVWRLAAVLAAPGLLAMACPALRNGNGTAPPGGTTTANIVFTAGVRGWVEPCGCTVEPLGGIHRVKGEADKARLEAPTLFVDAGDLLYDHLEFAPAALCQEEARVSLLLDSARAAGLVATGLGPFDLPLGDPARSGALKAQGIAALSANVMGATDVKPSMMKEVGGLRIGVVGLTWPLEMELPKDETTLSWRGLSLSNPQRALAREAGALRQAGAQVVMVLGNMARGQLAALLQAVPGIDLGIVGHEPGEEPTVPSEVARGSWLLSAGGQGQYLGKISLKIPSVGQSCCLAFDDNGQGARAEAERLKKKAAQLDAQAANYEASGDESNARVRRQKALELKAQAETQAKNGASGVAADVNRFTFEAIPLNRKAAFDDVWQSKLRAFKASLKSVNLKCEEKLSCPAPPAGSLTYVGTARCRECHEEAYAFWKKAIVKDAARAANYRKVPNHPNPEGNLGHARAWQTLVEAKATGNRDCIECHSVGFDQPGGFCKVRDAEKWGNVGCESCHGPGSKHSDTEEDEDIRSGGAEKDCRRCHMVPHIPTTESFVYAEKLRLILGPGHGEARLKKLGSAP